MDEADVLLKSTIQVPVVSERFIGTIETHPTSIQVSTAVRSMEHRDKIPEKVRASPIGESFKRRLKGHDE
jgi:hypothetical protein